MSELVFLRAAFSIMVIVCVVSVSGCLALHCEMKAMRRNHIDVLQAIRKQLGGDK